MNKQKLINELKKELKKELKNKEYIGYILHKHLEIEEILDTFLYTYFTENLREIKAEEFNDYILSDMSFEKKLQLLKKLKLKERNESGFGNTDFYNKINLIKEARNIVAHNLSYKFENKNKIVSKKNKTIVLSEEFMIHFLGIATDVKTELIGLFGDFCTDFNTDLMANPDKRWERK